MYAEDDLLPISALQHLLFCPRQCALIHIEQVWAENKLTAQGRQMHERAHEAPPESRRDVRIVRGLRLQSLSLGLTGPTSSSFTWPTRGRPPSAKPLSPAWRAGGACSPSSTSAAGPRPMRAIASSSAPRRCAWRRWSARGFRPARCTTVSRGGGRTSSSTTRCGGKSSPRQVNCTPSSVRASRRRQDIPPHVDRVP